MSPFTAPGTALGNPVNPGNPPADRPAPGAEAPLAGRPAQPPRVSTAPRTHRSPTPIRARHRGRGRSTPGQTATRPITACQHGAPHPPKPRPASARHRCGGTAPGARRHPPPPPPGGPVQPRTDGTRGGQGPGGTGPPDPAPTAARHTTQPGTGSGRPASSREPTPHPATATRHPPDDREPGAARHPRPRPGPFSAAHGRGPGGQTPQHER